jgi:CelD/BcsL family acetyltransferase involved in cellulose biosynthesis
MYLMVKVIEGFCEDSAQGVRAVDFGPGNSWYKQAICNEKWMETAVYIFAPTVQGFCLNIVRFLVGTVDHAIKRALERTNLLQKIKKAWRNRARPKEALHASA